MQSSTLNTLVFSYIGSFAISSILFWHEFRKFLGIPGSLLGAALLALLFLAAAVGQTALAKFMNKFLGERYSMGVRLAAPALIVLVTLLALMYIPRPH